MMKHAEHIKGIIFDYGGTIDTNGKHWAEVIWDSYQHFSVPISKEIFREAYVHGERTLALKPLIKPSHNFYDVLTIKIRIQIEYLIENKHLTDYTSKEYYISKISQECYEYAEKTTKSAFPIIEILSRKYKITLVSNFYGNIHEVLKNFGLLCSFNSVIESAIVGVRKPDPAIFTLGVKALGVEASETVVIGDSYSKDILPAKTAGCRTIWLKGIGWGEETDDSIPDAIITDLKQLTDLL